MDETTIGENLCASLAMPCDSESGETRKDASTDLESALAETVQCVAEVPRIVLWC